MDSFTRLERPDVLSYEGIDVELSEIGAAADLPLPIHRVVFGWWDGARGDRSMPAARDFDIAAVSEAAGWLHLLEVIEEGADFRYRVYGTLVAAATGLDLTGRRVSEQPEPVRTPLTALYRDMVLRPRPVRSLVHFPGPSVAAPRWDRIMLPLGEGGTVSRIVTASRPVDPPACG